MLGGHHLLGPAPGTQQNSLGLEAARTFSGYNGNQELGRPGWPGPLRRGKGQGGLWVILHLLGPQALECVGQSRREVWEGLFDLTGHKSPKS